MFTVSSEEESVSSEHDTSYKRIRQSDTQTAFVKIEPYIGSSLSGNVSADRRRFAPQFIGILVA